MSDGLRIVVADDSTAFRVLLSRCFADIDGVEIVARAKNGEEAIAAVREHTPDLLTLDLNMPVLDGLGTLRRLRDERVSCEVLVVSAETQQGAAATLEALQLGAVDFITKPSMEGAAENTEYLLQELRRKLAAVRLRRERVLVARMAKSPARTPATAMAMRPDDTSTAKTAIEVEFEPSVFAIGTSTGGPAALPVVLSSFPGNLGLPVLIVQHMPPVFTASLASTLDKKVAIRVVEAHDGQLIRPGTAYIAPGGHHMKVKTAFDGSVRVHIYDAPPVNYCRPAVDVLFRSIAEVYGGRVVAAILTGMGNDGVDGLKALKAKGARTIAQDEASCVVFGMPQEAIKGGAVDYILPLNRIGTAMAETVKLNGAN